jgi:hypothetical protein
MSNPNASHPLTLHPCDLPREEQIALITSACRDATTVLWHPAGKTENAALVASAAASMARAGYAGDLWAGGSTERRASRYAKLCWAWAVSLGVSPMTGKPRAVAA